MPLLSPRPNDPDVLARLSARQLNRTCLQQQVLHVDGEHFDETRTWCVKMQQWEPHQVNIRLNWKQIFQPLVQRVEKVVTKRLIN